MRPHLILCLFMVACRSGAGTAPTTSAEPANSSKPAATASAPAPSSSAIVDASPPSSTATPESFAASMTGTIACGKQKCKAGKEVCVGSPDPNAASRCEPISEWVAHRTPTIKGGLPNMAGVTACEGSHNCPPGSVCCLHEIGLAEVQAVVCHASLDECRDREETCSNSGAGQCRTPGTHCDKSKCVK